MAASDTGTSGGAPNIPSARTIVDGEPQDSGHVHEVVINQRLKHGTRKSRTSACTTRTHLSYSPLRMLSTLAGLMVLVMWSYRCGGSRVRMRRWKGDTGLEEPYGISNLHTQRGSSFAIVRHYLATLRMPAHRGMASTQRTAGGMATGGAPTRCLAWHVQGDLQASSSVRPSLSTVCNASTLHDSR